ncbi:hypothetical protein C818_00413 [Lachnospiraceae bacterium MD308]|nr:hypothetical protein C818_00413 [Lachnospiraceae bacterium MD308]
MKQIILDHVSFRYPNGFLANEDLNLTVSQEEQVAIVGQNGAGKTTAVKLMNGLNKPTEGTVFINDMDTKNYTTAQIAKFVGYVFQNPDDQIFNQTVYDEIAYMPKYYKYTEKETKRRVDEAADVMQIREYLKSNPYEIPYTIRKLVTIAAILVVRPEYIILDEPTAGQDLRGIRLLEELLSYLREQKIGVVTITHDMEFVADNFRRVVAMANKHIIADGSAREIFSRDEVIKESKIKRTEMGMVAKELGLGNDILNPKELADAAERRLRS